VLTELPVKLINGLARTKSEPDLRAGRTTAYLVSLLRVRCPEWKLINPGAATKSPYYSRHRHTSPPRFRALALFGRRPLQRAHTLVMAATENLRNARNRGGGYAKGRGTLYRKMSNERNLPIG